MDRGNVVVSVGDVSGKSIDSATMTSTVRSTIRAAAYPQFSPASILERANDSILRQVTPDSFITAVVLVINVEDGTFLYASAGHPPPIICRRNCESMPVTQGVPLGSFKSDFENRLGVLEVGDLLLFYTDGLVEAR